jgi:hypothetical protein
METYMNKHISRLVVASIAAAALAGSVLYAEAAKKSSLNEGPTAKSPVGTLLGSASLWAVIDGSNGAIVRSDGAAPATTHRLGAGVYEVGFFRNITGCAYQVTIGMPATSSSPPGEVTMASRAGNPNGVFITTHDSAGTLADRNFHLTVDC